MAGGGRNAMAGHQVKKRQYRQREAPQDAQPKRKTEDFGMPFHEKLTPAPSFSIDRGKPLQP
jgi:hypothetical protein